MRLLTNGYNVVINYSNDDRRAAETLDQCADAASRALLVKADVSIDSEVGQLISGAVEHFGSIDVLVNNAARVIDKPILDMTEQDWDQVVDVNMKGAFLCSKHAAQYMLEQETGGSIISIGASTGIRGRKNGINTCASKAGLMLMTQCLALELGPKIRVNTVVPGLTLTEETRRRFHLDDPAVLRARTDLIPLQRIGRPEDVADAVMMLLSEQARFVTGQRLVVDGGQYMW